MRGGRRTLGNVRSFTHLGRGLYLSFLDFGFLDFSFLDLGLLQHLIHGFPLSGPESGHTERRAARNAAVATVLFHPDFDRRLRNHTESADPFSQGDSKRSPRKKALAGLGFSTLTAGGDFHPALRTSAARHERPKRNYDERLRRQQAPLPWGIRVSP